MLESEGYEVESPALFVFLIVSQGHSPCTFSGMRQDESSSDQSLKDASHWLPHGQCAHSHDSSVIEALIIN